jgi:hypothetical protein
MRDALHHMISHEQRQLERKRHILSACMGLMPMLPTGLAAPPSHRLICACLPKPAAAPDGKNKQDVGSLSLRPGEEKARVEAMP